MEKETENKIFHQEVLNNAVLEVRRMNAIGAIAIPHDYSVENALLAAWFVIQKINNGKNKGYKPALEVCEKQSVSMALIEMVTYGLNPSKKQCSFIIRGNQLCFTIEYQGAIALAKRFAGVQSVIARTIHEGDDVIYKQELDGREYVVSHKQPIENLDKPIKGAYCTIVDSEGKPQITKMTISMIEQSWGQGDMFKYQDSTHKKFPIEMSKKTVINLACKPFINSSNDDNILPDTEGVDYVNTTKPELSFGKTKELKPVGDDFVQNAEESKVLEFADKYEKEFDPGF